MRTLMLGVLLSLPSLCLSQLQVSTPNVPPGTYSGLAVPANWTTIAIERNAKVSDVYFSVNGPIPGTNIHPGQIYYNVMTKVQAPFLPTWQYPNSVPVLTFPDASIALGDVLHDATAPFFNVRDGRFYSYVMYIIVQPTACDGIIAGFLTVSFSNDGLTWWSDPSLPNMLAQRLAGPSGWPCLTAYNTVPVIAFSAVYDSVQHVITGVGMEGNVALLTNPANYGTTQTYVGQALASDPTTFTIVGGLSPLGIGQPNAIGCTSYRYCLSIASAFEPGTGLFYITRLYPYPHDILWTVGVKKTPCNSSCPSGIYTFQNRAQVYSMYIGDLSNVGRLLTGYWTLLTDVGAGVGYTAQESGCFGGVDCVSTPLTIGQETLGLSAGPMTLRRLGDGTVAYAPSLGYSNLEFEMIGTTNFDITCTRNLEDYDTQPRQVLLQTTRGPAYQGYLDSVDCSTHITGWAWDASSPSAAVNVEILDGATLIASVPANAYRADLAAAGIGDGTHGFSVTLAPIHDGSFHSFAARVQGTAVGLLQSPRSVSCPQ